MHYGMALLRSFKKQMEKRKCPACGIILTAGKYRSHVSYCFMASDDEDCQVIEKVTPEDKKRRAMEQMICLDDSDDDANSKKAKTTAKGTIEPKEENQQPCCSKTIVNARSSSVSNAKEATPQKSSQETTTLRDKGNGQSPARASQEIALVCEELRIETDSVDVLLDMDFENTSIIDRSAVGSPVKRTPSKPTRVAKRKALSAIKKRPAQIKIRRKGSEKSSQKAVSGSPVKPVEDPEVSTLKPIQAKSVLVKNKPKQQSETSVVGEPSTSASKNRAEPSPRVTRKRCNESEVGQSSTSASQNCTQSSLRVTRSKSQVTLQLTLDEVAEQVQTYLKDVQTELSPLGAFVPSAQPETERKECSGIDGGEASGMKEQDDENSNEDKAVSSPYYAIFFMKILRKVFYNSPYPPSFWGEDLRFVQKFISVSEKSKQLFVKIFIRKRRWLLAEHLSYAQIAPNLVPLFVELHKVELVDSCKSGLNDLSEAIKLLHAPALKEVAKKFKINSHAGKLDITRELLKMSLQKNVLGMRNENRMLQVVKQHLGPCYRLREDAWRLFNAAFTLYSPSDMSSSVLLDQPSVNLASQLMFVLLQLATNKVRYPAPPAPPLIDMYSDKEMLFRYVRAKELEAEMADSMGRGRWQEVFDLAGRAKELYLMDFSEQMAGCKDLTPHLRRFTDLWVLTRCMSIGTEALQRLRKYEEAVDWIRYLLNNEDAKLFSMDSRGGWWDRLALNLDCHLRRKDEALEAINMALQDVNLADKQLLLLQDRGMRISSSWKGPLNVPDPERVDITGSILSKNLGDARTNRFMIQRNGNACECPVEEVALDHFIRHEFKEGTHSEGTIWHTVFGFLCYDVLFDHDVENVWFSETRPNPADLNFRALYTNRASSFDLRFNLIESCSHDDLIDMIEPVYEQHFGVTNSEISWTVFSNLAQVKRFVRCCKPQLLTAVFRRIVTDYRNCRSGFPDLTVWNDETSQIAVIEVKGPGDKLSTKQRLWLHHFHEHGVIAQVCHVSARSSRWIDDD